ncbi:RAD55 family ATPase [Thermococcus sp.]
MWFNMQVVTSGLRDMDHAVGGGLVKGSSLLVIYDSFSLGWAMPFKILKYQLSKGYLGIIINYNLPLPKLILRGKSVGLDIEEEGKKGNLIIIDVFGSKYDFHYPGDYIYKIEVFNPETYIPKLEQIYREIFKKTNKTGIVEFVFSVDGMAFEIGEDRTVKLIKRLLSNKTINGRHLFSIYLLNKDRVSMEFLSWNIEFNDYVVEFLSERNNHEISEQMYVLKSPLFEFEPSVYKYDIKHQNIIPVKR